MLDLQLLARQSLLFAHLVVFALAMAAILAEDLRLLFARRIDSRQLHHTAGQIKWLLVGLWLTGGLLTAVELNGDFLAILGKPKLMSKLTVVVALTINGFALHSFALPMMTRPQANPRFAASICSVIGAISTSSWLFASFVGTARHVAPYLTYQHFMWLYGAAVGGAVIVALLFVRSRLVSLLAAGTVDEVNTHADQHLQSALCEMETAIAALSRLQQTLQTPARASIVPEQATPEFDRVAA